MKGLLFAFCFILAALVCSPAMADCSGGACRPVARAAKAVGGVVHRIRNREHKPVRRALGWVFGR